MHEADDAYSIRSTWSCYWLDQFLTLALNILILSIFTFQWICLPIILLILVGVELPLRVVVTILECCVTFSGVKLSIRSFVLFGSRRTILDIKTHFFKVKPVFQLAEFDDLFSSSEGKFVTSYLQNWKSYHP